MQIKKGSPLKSNFPKKLLTKQDYVQPSSQSPKGKKIKEKLINNERDLTALNLYQDQHQQIPTRFGPYTKFLRQAKTKIEKPQQSLSLYHQNFNITKITRDVSQESHQRKPSICDNLPVYFPKVINNKECINENNSQEPSCVFYNIRALEQNQKTVINQQSYYSPKSDFYLGSQKPVRINQKFSRIDSSKSKSEAQISPPTSTRDDIKDYFQQLNKVKQGNEIDMTIRQRNNLNTLQQMKLQEIGQQQNQLTRVSSQNSSQTNLDAKRLESRSQEDGKKYQSDHKSQMDRILYFGDNELKTILYGQYQPSMVERNLKKKLMLKRQQIQVANSDNYFSQDKCSLRGSQEIMSIENRIQSTRSPVSAIRLIGDYDPKNDTQDQSPNILFNLQKNQNQAIRDTFAKAHKPALIQMKLINNSQNTPKIKAPQQIGHKILTEPKDDPNTQYFNQSPLMKKKDIDIDKYKGDLLKSNEYQIQKSTRTEHAYHHSSNDRIELLRQETQAANKLQTVKTERILDLLLLSTCELKNYFNNDPAAAKRPSKYHSKKVKIFHSKQLFPGDFFNISNK